MKPKQFDNSKRSNTGELGEVKDSLEMSDLESTGAGFLDGFLGIQSVVGREDIFLFSAVKPVEYGTFYTLRDDPGGKGSVPPFVGSVEHEPPTVFTHPVNLLYGRGVPEMLNYHTGNDDIECLTSEWKVRRVSDDIPAVEVDSNVPGAWNIDFPATAADFEDGISGGYGITDGLSENLGSVSEGWEHYRGNLFGQMIAHGTPPMRIVSA